MERQTATDYIKEVFSMNIDREELDKLTNELTADEFEKLARSVLNQVKPLMRKVQKNKKLAKDCLCIHVDGDGFHISLLNQEWICCQMSYGIEIKNDEIGFAKELEGV